jgi:hypothetical protein
MAIISRDSGGNLWQAVVNPDGSWTSIPVSSDLQFTPNVSRDVNGQLWLITPNADGSLETTPIADSAAPPTATPLQNISRDPNGQLWQYQVQTDGSIKTTPVTDASVVSTGGDECTVTLQSVVNLASTHVDLMPLANVGGYIQEPALSLSNDTLQELLAQPYDWKFNSHTTNQLVTQSARQDYLFAGASAFIPGIGGVSIGLADGGAITEDASNNVTVKCLQPHNFTVGQTVFMTGNTLAAYNSSYLQTPEQSIWTGGWAITAVPDPYTFVFVHAQASLDPSGAAGIRDCSWLESAIMYDTSDTNAAPTTWEVSAVKSLKKSNHYGRPQKIALISQSNGVLSLRLTHIPRNPVWAITINYQKKAPLKTDLSQTWSPFPDEFGFVYRQMFLARSYRYLNHRRADAEEARALAMIAKALGKDDVEQSDQYVTPERPLMGDFLGW